MNLFLHFADHVEFDPLPGRTTQSRNELQVPSKFRDGRWWLEPGPDIPPGVELIEGPLSASGTRCHVDFLVDARCRVGPASSIARVRPMTDADEKLLDAVRKVDADAGQARQAIQDCIDTAQVGSSQGTVHEHKSPEQRRDESAAFLQAKYTKKDRKENQKALFPELEQAIAQGRKDMDLGIKWPMRVLSENPIRNPRACPDTHTLPAHFFDNVKACKHIHIQ